MNILELELELESREDGMVCMNTCLGSLGHQRPDGLRVFGVGILVHS